MTSKKQENTLVPAVEMPEELKQFNINPALLYLNDEDLATRAYALQNRLADFHDDFKARIAQMEADEFDLKAILLYRMQKNGGKTLPHSTLDVGYTQATQRKRDESTILALREEYPEVQLWDDAIVTEEVPEVVVPAQTVRRIDLRGVDAIIRKLGAGHNLSRALAEATAKIPKGEPVVVIKPRADLQKNVTPEKA